MAFATSFTSGVLLLRSCRNTSTRLAIHAFSRPTIRSLSLVSQCSGSLARHGTLKTFAQTRAFSRTAPARSNNEATAPANGTAVNFVSTTADQVAPAASSEAADAVSSSGIVENALSHFPSALQYGDFAALGLAGWSPAGLIRWSFELINVSTGLPWFWTIVAGSLFWKVVLVPLSVAGLRNSARLLPLQGQILQRQKELNKIRESGDKLALQKHALKMRKMYQDAGVNMGVTALSPFVQIPVTLGMFFAVKTMCQLPVPQLAYSGLDILPDLTVADPYMILPIALCAAVNLQISVGAAELNLKERPETGHIMNGLRVLSIVGVWVMSTFPSGLLVSLLTTSLATTVQSLALQVPKIRRGLDIPIVASEYRGRLPTMKETGQYLIKAWKRKVSEAQAQARQR
ncbi:hypothetical protein AMATHDRAFT_64539 [Amanita thiersii Skay4041]|uniref:Membrane insertase YidC/Oxa/ALB C-terminal domain-containing protein n=1 Tax=Amanita thiersii Skay4041 TaxID=703135 RepID=A0A2A9NFK9_9AGAR|nr:hypothetical protein AMATHDRAFT_64539 [Amanita thiersii Skay4041]